jgi:hypothetical protein
LTEGQGTVGGRILPPPDGIWGMPADVLHTMPGYGPDVQKNRAASRASSSGSAKTGRAYPKPAATLDQPAKEP